MEKNKILVISTIIVAIFILSVSSLTGMATFRTRTLNTQYPLILVHGHSQPMPFVTWEAYKSKLVSDGYYTDKGLVTIYTTPQFNSWPKNSAVLTTYYNPSPTDPIDVYAQRLSKVIDTVLKNTGANKVDIVAHSMGGLVSRAYIEKMGGSSKIRKLIMAGTPNKGIADLSAMGCPTLEPECKDMKVNSPFLQSLNINNHGNVQYSTIAGDAAKGTDGVVQVSSVQINSVPNIILNGYTHWGLISAPGTPDYQEYNVIISLLDLQQVATPQLSEKQSVLTKSLIRK